MATALVLVDIQNDYFPGGKNECVGATECAQKAAELLKLFREKQKPVVHIQHLSRRPGSTFFIPGTVGAEIHELVKPADGEVVLEKAFPNSFRGTALLEKLQSWNVRRLIIVGMMTHMCIDATTRAAFDYGFECIVPYDACATRRLTSYGNAPVEHDKVHRAFLAALSYVYAKVVSTEVAKRFISCPCKARL